MTRKEISKQAWNTVTVFFSSTELGLGLTFRSIPVRRMWQSHALYADVVEKFQRDLHSFRRHRAHSALDDFIDEWTENYCSEVDFLVNGPISGKDMEVCFRTLR